MTPGRRVDCDVEGDMSNKLDCFFLMHGASVLVSVSTRCKTLIVDMDDAVMFRDRPWSD